MLPTAPDFYLFAFALFFLYWPLRAWQPKAAVWLICLANLFCFAKWGWVLLAIIPVAATFDYLLGKAIFRATTMRRLLVSLSLLANVSLIILSRYIPLLAGPDYVRWVLPLSLSFYAFQAMTYTIDIYRKDAKPAASFADYFAAVSFFPTIIAGPINPVSKLAVQWQKKTVLSAAEGSRAVFLIGLGLVKKFLIADYLAKNLVNRVFDLPTLYSGGDCLAAVYAYAFQLYYDFSGYSDIATGVALLFGIKVALNFNSPYRAESIANFWRRWHISLSNWLTNYLYYSLPGKRIKMMLYLNLVITMAIGGIWHGASWNFLIWGVLHGLGLACFRLIQTKQQDSPLWLRVPKILLTFHFVTFAWIFFRTADLQTALLMLGQIASMKFTFDNVTPGFALILAIAIICHYLPKSWMDWSMVRFNRIPAPLQAAAAVGLILSIRYVAATGAAPFIYSKF